MRGLFLIRIWTKKGLRHKILVFLTTKKILSSVGSDSLIEQTYLLNVALHLEYVFLLKLIIKKIYLIHHPLKYGEAVKILTPENKAPSQKLLSHCLAQKSN